MSRGIDINSNIPHKFFSASYAIQVIINVEGEIPPRILNMWRPHVALAVIVVLAILSYFIIAIPLLQFISFNVFGGATVLMFVMYVYSMILIIREKGVFGGNEQAENKSICNDIYDE